MICVVLTLWTPSDWHVLAPRLSPFPFTHMPVCLCCACDWSCTIYRLSIIIAMYMCTIVTLQSLPCRRQMNSSNFKGTWRTLCIKPLHAQRSTNHISSYSVYWSRPRPGTWSKSLVTTMKNEQWTREKCWKWRLSAKENSNVSYLELFRLQEGWYWPNTCSVSTVPCNCCHNRGNTTN